MQSTTRRTVPGVRETEVPAASVIIVGSGLAGCCAAVEASKKGASVFIVEKEDAIGGNSMKAASGITSVKTDVQKHEKIADSKMSLKFDALRDGQGKNDETLVDLLANGALDAGNWVQNELGLELNMVFTGGGHSHPRVHNMATPEGETVQNIGLRLMNAVANIITSRSTDGESDPTTNASCDGAELKPGKIELMTGCRVVDFLKTPYEKCSHERIIGVKYSDKQGDIHELNGDAVILATGGFAYDRFKGSSLLAEYAPHLLDLPTTSGPQATGDGHKLARSIGATLVDMGEMQVHPTGLIDPADPNNINKWLAPEKARGYGAIMVNHLGERFCNELGTRNYTVTEMFSKCCPITKFPPPLQPEGHADKRRRLSDESIASSLASDAPTRTCPPQVGAFLILNEECAEKFGPRTARKYCERGLFRRCANVAEVAEVYGLPEAGLRETIETYRQQAHAGQADQFGKILFQVKDWSVDEPLYVGMVTPCLHYTCGGIKINSSSEVMMQREDGSFAPILGLFAAGECTGGVHGASRVVGNSLLDCVVFGRLAGRRAAETTREVLPALDPETFTPLRLRHKAKLQHTTNFEFSFELPSPLHHSGLETGQYIAVRSVVDGEPKTRFYSPITRKCQHGSIDLLIKTSPAESTGMTRHIMDLKPGQYLEFCGPKGGFNFDLMQVPKIGLIAGGVGISPMIQIIREVMYSKKNVEVTLLWGVEFMSELVYMQKLEKLQQQNPNLKVVYVLNHPPFSWEGEVGFIDKDKICKYMPQPGDQSKIIVCGTWKMCQVMKGLLPECGYEKDNFYSFM
uniref:FAD-binding FR-type domain-containing protein n=1 Tax=Heterosigma akashiwo TaxID=2829 RepID=A0A7S3Y663_HETAK